MNGVAPTWRAAPVRGLMTYTRLVFPRAYSCPSSGRTSSPTMLSPPGSPVIACEGSTFVTLSDWNVTSRLSWVTP